MGLVVSFLGYGTEAGAGHWKLGPEAQAGHWKVETEALTGRLAGDPGY